MLADFIAIGLSPKNIEHGCWGIPRLSRRLAQVPTRSQRPIKLIIPGIEGCYQSATVRLLVNHPRFKEDDIYILSHKNIQPGTEDKPHMYHAAWLDDLTQTVSQLKKHFVGRPIHIIAYSLGSNMLLQFLAKNPGVIDYATAISTPFCLSSSASAIPKFYQKLILRSMRRRFKFCDGEFHEVFNAIDWQKINSIKALDSAITAPYFGFSSVEDYYQKASSQYVLQEISTKVLLISAEDDPFIPASSLPNVKELPNNFNCQFFRYGGHVGFVDWRQLRPYLWLVDAILSHEKS